MLTTVISVPAAQPKAASGALLLVLLKMVSSNVRNTSHEPNANIQSGQQQMGRAVSAAAGAQVKMNCEFLIPGLSSTCDLADTFPDKYNDSTKRYDQTVYVNGAIISTLSTGELSIVSQFPCTQLTHIADSGVAQGWGTAAECQAAACGTYAAHEYINTKIIMNVADPNYARTKATTGASGDLVTADGGKTWTVRSIKIQGGVFA
jgi:hypothetical protein